MHLSIAISIFFDFFEIAQFALRNDVFAGLNLLTEVRAECIIKSEYISD